MNNISETAYSEILVRWSTKMPGCLVLWYMSGLCRKHYIAIILTSVCRKILIHLFHFYCLCLLLDRLLMASNIPSSAVIRPIVSPVKVFALSWLQRNCSVSSISLSTSLDDLLVKDDYFSCLAPTSSLPFVSSTPRRKKTSTIS